MTTRTENWIVTFVALVTMFGGFLADYNETHIFNSRWTPHAKYHTGQTISLGFALGLSALYFVWRRKGDQPFQFRAALLVASLYWVTQLTAGLFPGVAFVDPEFADRVPTLGGIPVQIVVDAALLGLLAVAYIMRRAWREPGPRPAA